MTRGTALDEQALADALEQLTPARRSTMRVTGGTDLRDHRRVWPAGVVGPERNLDRVLAVDTDVERGPDGSLRTLSISTPWSNDDLDSVRFEGIRRS